MEIIQRRDSQENGRKSLSDIELTWELLSRIYKELKTLHYKVAGNPVSKRANEINQVIKRCNYIWQFMHEKNLQQPAIR